jgi:hypothetical protein
MFIQQPLKTVHVLFHTRSITPLPDGISACPKFPQAPSGTRIVASLVVGIIEGKGTLHLGNRLRLNARYYGGS